MGVGPCVVIDANLLDCDRDMGNRWMRALLQASRDGKLKLAVPEVVVQELVAHQRAAFEQHICHMRKAFDAMGPYLDEAAATAPALPSADELAERYEEALCERVLEADGLIPSLPTVSHDELLQRAAAKRRPFSGHDTGYRDALLWHTTLELTAEYEKVLFCTNDKDFLDKADPPRFHSALQADLDTHGVLPDAIRLFASIEAVVREYITDDPAVYLAEAELKDTAERVSELLASGFEDRALEQELGDLILAEVSALTIDVMSPANPVSVDPVGDLAIQAVELDELERSDEGELVAKLQIRATLRVRYEVEMHDRDGGFISGGGTSRVTLDVPASATFDAERPRFADVAVDSERVWGVIEDYEPMP